MDPHSNASSSMLVRMEVPGTAALCCLTASIDPKHEKDPSAQSPYHWQIFNCRLLLFTAPVMASPVLGNERDILLVCSKADQERGRLDAHLARLKLRGRALRAVTSAEYSSCLNYTVQAYLAPEWNIVENLLVQGRDFLSSNEPRDAISSQVNINQEEMRSSAWLRVEAHRIRMPRMSLADFNISPPSVHHEFLGDPAGSIDSMGIGAPWVHVLPSLKKGMVVNISKRIPPECPYQTYKDLRRHWKNMYGYRLPEEAEGMVYCQVYFRPLGWTLYTYPLQCLCPHRPAKLRAYDPHASVASFLGELVRKLPQVCGHPVSVHTDRLNLPVTELYPAREPHKNLREEAIEPGSQACPLSVATQPDGVKPRFLWNQPGSARPDAEKENSHREVCEDTEPQMTAPTRPVFRPVFKAAARPKVIPSLIAKPRMKPTFNRSNPGPSTAEATANVSDTPPLFLMVPVHKPIFLSTIKPKAPVAGASKMIGKQVSNPSKRLDAGAGAGATAGSASPAAAARGAVKRPADMQLPEFTTADQVRRVNVPTLLAWLRARGVACRVKDKKAELVEKVLHNLNMK